MKKKKGRVVVVHVERMEKRVKGGKNRSIINVVSLKYDFETRGYFIVANNDPL